MFFKSGKTWKLSLHDLLTLFEGDKLVCTCSSLLVLIKAYFSIQSLNVCWNRKCHSRNHTNLPWRVWNSFILKVQFIIKYFDIWMFVKLISLFFLPVYEYFTSCHCFGQFCFGQFQIDQWRTSVNPFNWFDYII